jgi:hypothetical protein
MTATSTNVPGFRPPATPDDITAVLTTGGGPTVAAAEALTPRIDYDVNAALEAGLTARDIADYLAGQTNYDVGAAREAGVSDDAIIAELSTARMPSRSGRYYRGRNARRSCGCSNYGRCPDGRCGRRSLGAARHAGLRHDRHACRAFCRHAGRAGLRRHWRVAHRAGCAGPSGAFGRWPHLWWRRGYAARAVLGRAAASRCRQRGSCSCVLPAALSRGIQALRLPD